MRKLAPALLALVLLCLAVPVLAGGRPETIRLPDGWQPEGIAAQGSRLYVGSLASGAVWTGDVRGRRTGVLVPGQAGRSAAGLKVAGNRILVSGAASGRIYVYDKRTGADVRTYDVGGGFINDVAVRGAKAYFTDSVKPVLYVVPRRASGPAQTLPITGDLVYDTTPGVFNANGIVALGRQLIVVQTSTGRLFRIDPATGVSRAIDLGGATLVNGDGLLLRGRTLYVVQNQNNQIAVVRLAGNLASGRVTGTITDPDFDVPTTLARAAGSLYAVNARFTTPPTPTTRYGVVRVTPKQHRGHGHTK